MLMKIHAVIYQIGLTVLAVPKIRHAIKTNKIDVEEKAIQIRIHMKIPG